MTSEEKKILLVEDEKTIRDAVAAYLERHHRDNKNYRWIVGPSQRRRTGDLSRPPAPPDAPRPLTPHPHHSSQERIMSANRNTITLEPAGTPPPPSQ